MEQEIYINVNTNTNTCRKLLGDLLLEYLKKNINMRYCYFTPLPPENEEGEEVSIPSYMSPPSEEEHHFYNFDMSRFGIVTDERAYMPTPKEERALVRVDVPGWGESDYLDNTDLLNLMGKGEPWSYAQCQWLMGQEDNNVAFPQEVWERMYTYAVEHCPSFAKVQPRWRRQ